MSKDMALLFFVAFKLRLNLAQSFSDISTRQSHGQISYAYRRAHFGLRGDMTKFAVCNHSTRIWQIDTATPSPLPLVVHSSPGSKNREFQSLALATDKEFELVCCNGDWDDNIIKTKGGLDEALVCDPGDPAIRPAFVRVRTIEGGLERIYFSAYRNANSAGGCNAIYYIDNGVAVLYAEIDFKKMTFPNPSDPGVGPQWYWWEGDFDFGDGDVLYLSTGKLSAVCGNQPASMTVGVYKIEGAGPDTLTGTVQPIHQGAAPIYGLCYRSPNVLYFLRDKNAIWKLNLNNMSETLEGSFSLPSNPMWGDAWDMAEVGEGMAQPAYWPLVTLAYKWIYAIADWLYLSSAALALRGRGRPPSSSDEPGSK